jgi:hypothetical protein
MVKVLVVAEGLWTVPAASPRLSPDGADMVSVMRFQNLLSAVCLYKRHEAHSNRRNLQSI